jgi:uncharacterized SAM-binding protein YcdF (DUF218 family)
MFLASKLLAFAIEPLVWVLCLLLGGLLSWSRWPRLGRGLAWGALVALLLSGWELIPNTLLRALESRYPPPPAAAEIHKYVGVVVVGGALSNSALWTVHRQVALNANAERMTTAVSLALKYPHLRLLYTGGIATVTPEGLTEAVRARMFFDQMGVDPARVLYEDRSRTTYENAYYSAGVPGVNKHDKWLLLTSAYHMPRTMGVFLKVGWNVTPYPVDYRSAAPSSWSDFSLHDGPGSWELALHELLGYLAYRLNGMI